MEKKGSHVGLVLSFVLFVVFLIFVYSIISPAVERRQNQKLAVEILREGLVGEISSELTTVILVPGAGCNRIDDSDVGTEDASEVIAKDSEGNTIKSRDFGDYVFINSSDEDILWVYYSDEEFNSEILNEVGCADGTVRSVKKETYVFGSRVGKFAEDYDNSYNTLKSKIGLPVSNEFGFRFDYGNGTVVEKTKEQAGDVYSQELPVQYVNSDGNFMSGAITIVVW